MGLLTGDGYGSVSRGDIGTNSPVAEREGKGKEWAVGDGRAAEEVVVRTRISQSGSKYPSNLTPPQISRICEELLATTQLLSSYRPRPCPSLQSPSGVNRSNPSDDSLPSPNPHLHPAATTLVIVKTDPLHPTPPLLLVSRLVSVPVRLMVSVPVLMGGMLSAVS